MELNGFSNERMNGGVGGAKRNLKIIMLYTRKGDKGTTKTLDLKPGERISKSSCRTESLGALDELNSYLGLVRAALSRPRDLGFKTEDLKIRSKSFAEICFEVQENLFIIQSELAGSGKAMTEMKVKAVEELVDAAEREMPPIKTFFIPGATELGALFDVARTLARKAERRVVAAVEQETRVGEHTLSYLNRLSSLLYALARLSNHKLGASEQPPTYK